MIKPKIYFRVEDLAEDENGNPAPAGMCLNLGDADLDMDYQTFTSRLTGEAIAELLAMLGLDELDPAKVSVITPEAYMEEFGEDDD